jgi:hypothetical protein
MPAISHASNLRGDTGSSCTGSVLARNKAAGFVADRPSVGEGHSGAGESVRNSYIYKGLQWSGVLTVGRVASVGRETMGAGNSARRLTAAQRRLG